MITIPQIMGFPDKTPVDAVQGRLKVYERKELDTKYGPTTVQEASLEDVAGNKIKLKVWKHPDLTPMDGQEVVVFSGGKGGKGISVEHESWEDKKTGAPKKAIRLSVSRDGQFQTVAIYNQHVGKGSQTPDKAVSSHSEAQGVSQPTATGQNPVKGQQSAPAGVQTIRGDKVGMAINNAVQLILAVAEQHGLPENLIGEVGQKASDIIRLSNWLEQGNLYPEKTYPEKKAKPSEPPNEEVPF